MIFVGFWWYSEMSWEVAYFIDEQNFGILRKEEVNLCTILVVNVYFLIGIKVNSPW